MRERGGGISAQSASGRARPLKRPSACGLQRGNSQQIQESPQGEGEAETRDGREWRDLRHANCQGLDFWITGKVLSFTLLRHK